MIGLPGPELTRDDEARLDRIRPASVILFTRNFRSVAQIKSLIRRTKEIAGPQCRLAIDHEGGRVVRFPDALPPFPAPRLFGEARDPEKMRQAAKTAACALKDWGFDLNLAPVVDVLTPTSHPRMVDRCFGPDPDLVSEMAEAFIRGMREGGIQTCAKHFPGVGPAELDPHETGPKVTVTRQEQEKFLLPFRRAISAGVDTVMISHIVYTNLDPSGPATLSKKIITDLLKAEMGFDREILSDDLEMGAIQEAYGIEEAVTRARDAGCSILLVCKEPDLQDRAWRALAGRGHPHPDPFPP
ncbi:MAG: hypothetical protein A3G34_04515 [Candidatus Lindowbacteria bacterium RIFCSPLOWO2_12_FULL_62_27]|nr:MAG: hypothetical protein A3G34_04515 [Candidatus Lindowbacteria bacterium RIFCSPLOWO2_12_FULL_62_27]